MSPLPHSIGRVVFETGLHGRERVAALQKRISAFAAARLHSILAESLSLLAGTRIDDLLIFYKVELDLGTISLNHLEEDLEAGIARCLRDWALRAVPMHRRKLAEPASDSDKQGHRHAPAASLPSLLPAGPVLSASEPQLPLAIRGGLNAAVASALRGPGDWPQLMAIVRENQAFRSRLAGEVSPQLLRQLLQSLVPANGAAMADLAMALVTLHDIAPLVSADRHAFRRIVWECVLTEVARYQPGGFSLHVFISRVIDLLAARYSLEYSLLAAKVRKELQELSRTSGTALPAIIFRELKAAVSHAIDTQHCSLAIYGALAEASELREPASTGRSSQPSGDLAFFLEWGVLPSSTLHATRHHAESEMIKCLATWPDDICVLVRRLGKTERVRKRIAGQFSEKAVHRLIAALDPVNAPWMILFIRQLRRLHAQKQLVALQNCVFAQLLWELALEYLAERHWHALDAGSFLRFLLQRLAVRQKVSYELLLADLAIRRSPDPQRAPVSKDTGAQALVNSTIVALLEDDILGITSRLPRPRFVVQPAFQHLYCDLDVLVYWLRWQRLPSWTLARDPEEVAQHIGPLLRELPPEVRNVRKEPAKPSAPSGSTPARASLLHESPAHEIQIERWLLYGAWPAGVSVPQNTALVGWLESQNDIVWLHALHRCGARDQVVHRLVNHMPFAFLLRIAGLLAGPGSAAAVRPYLGALQAVGRHIAGSFLPPWQEQVSRYTLVHLLRNSATGSYTAVSVEELAHTTLQGLSLRCQVSFERLLILLRKESQGQQVLEELCRKLETPLEHLPTIHLGTTTANLGPIFSESTGHAASSGSYDLVLYYVKHGSLPAGPCELSLRALQHLAGQITDGQLDAMARSSLPPSPQNKEVLQRAKILFSPKTFVRFNACMSQAAPVAAQPVTPPAADFAWPQRESPLRPQLSPDDNAKNTAVSTAAQDIPAATEAHGNPAKNGPGTESEGTHTSGGRFRVWLDALGHLLRTGNLPWWGDALASPASSWFTTSLQSEPGPILQTLRSVAASPRAIDRLMRYAPRPDLAGVIRQAAPEYGGLLILYIEIGAALAEDNSLSASQRSHTPGLHWRETLLFVLDENPPSRVPAEALRALCRRVSQQLGLATTRYLQSLSAAVSRRAPSESGNLALAHMLSKIQPAPSSTEEKPHDLNSTHISEHDSAIGLETLSEHGAKAAPAKPTPQPATRETTHAKAEVPGKPESDVGNAASKEPTPELAPNDAIRTDVDVSTQPCPASGEDAALERTPAPAATDAKTGENVAANSDSDTGGAIAERQAPAADRELREKLNAAHDLKFPNETTTIGQLECLLRYGALPPAAAAKSLPQFMDDLTEALIAHPEAYRPLLREAASHDLERKRIARLFSPQALSRVWPLLLPVHHAQAVVCLDALHSGVSCSTDETGDRLRQTCVEELLRIAGGSPRTRWESAVYLKRAIQRLVEDHSMRAAKIVAHLRQGLLRQPRDIQRRLGPAVDRVERETAVMLISQPTSSTSAGQASASGSHPAPHIEKPSPPLPAGEPFYIGNAGVILLWPFLTRYFQNLELMEMGVPGKDKSAFRSETERSRAAHLVQYLAAGTLEAPEHALLLNKVLCGARPEYPLEPVGPVTEAEEALSTQMLNAVISNWQKLRNTSIEGLRQSFLLREGRLLRRDSDDAWSLTVSVKGYDILLDSLPWRFSTIRLPWMQTVLHVKWR